MKVQIKTFEIGDEKIIPIIYNSIKPTIPTKQEVFEDVVFLLESKKIELTLENISTELLKTRLFSDLEVRQYINKMCKLGFIKQIKPNHFELIRKLSDHISLNFHN